MYKADQIKILEIEATNICNASCPQCLRTNEETTERTEYNDVLDFDRVLANTSLSFWSGLETINFNGNTGDSIAHPDIKNIVLSIAKVAPQARIKISTNASLRNASWWKDFGTAVADLNCVVIFGIDGLADTHALYRVGTNWDHIIKNARAFIAAGGRAVWQMIPFQHNQHQIEDCKKLSEELGFIGFVVRSQNRFPTNQNSQPVFFKGKQTHVIAAPDMEPTDTICQSMEGIDTTRRIDCQSIKTNWLAIYADGTVWPCCFLMGWHRAPHQGRTFQIINYHFKKVLGLDFSTLNLYNNTLEDIINGDIWQKRYPASFANMPNPVCLQQCSV